MRGTEQNPGELRSSQNWIGPSGCTIATASFVPPNIEDLSNTLQDLERFINEPQVEMDPIVRAALVHYQFETAHPFLDGNGRLGRLLITLMLINDGVLHSCLFYPSFQFKKNRSEYYRQLTSVRERGTYEEWIEFFCNSLLESAKDSVGSLKNLVDLHNRSTATITENLGRTAANGQRLLGILEEHPIVDTAFIAAQLDIGRSTASSLIKSFEELGILRPLDESRQRYRQYGYKEYLSILREDAEPIR